MLFYACAKIDVLNDVKNKHKGQYFLLWVNLLLLGLNFNEFTLVHSLYNFYYFMNNQINEYWIWKVDQYVWLLSFYLVFDPEAWDECSNWGYYCISVAFENSSKPTYNSVIRKINKRHHNPKIQWFHYANAIFLSNYRNGSILILQVYWSMRVKFFVLERKSLIRNAHLKVFMA